MSMLAERKHKQKWCLNPRGNLWAEDGNKFGKRMLEKMGWKDGKGLGANENGATEHVKVSYKNDSKGMGFKENGEQWTEHEDKFSTLLKSLHSNGNAEENETVSNDKKHISGKSLEKESQKSRARVHYHKFTRGKDLTRYSEKDLANIFGKKSLKPVEKPREVIEEKMEDDSNGGERNKFGVETLERGSMVDYFKQKLAQFSSSSKGSYEIGSNGVLKPAMESDSESDAKVGFGFVQSSTAKSDKPSFVSYVKEAPENEEKKKKKKRKLAEESDEMVQSGSKKQKLEEGFVNPAFDPLSKNIIVGIKHSLTTITEENGDESMEESGSDKLEESPKPASKPKNNKKQKLAQTIQDQQNSCFSNGSLENLDEVDDFTAEETPVFNPYEVTRQSKKKNNKKEKTAAVQQQEEISYCNGAMEENGPEETQETINLDLYEVKRKPKKDKKRTKSKPQEEIGVDNPILSITIEDSNLEDDSISIALPQEAEECNSETKRSKKRKQKKQKPIQVDEIIDVDDPTFIVSSNSEHNSSIQQFEVTSVNTFEIESNDKPKKSKKKLKKAIQTQEQAETNGFDNPALNLSVEDDEIGIDNPSLDFETERKPSKKQKKSKAQLDGVDNPALNINSSSEEADKPAKKNKKKAKSGVDNPVIIDIDSSPETPANAPNSLPKTPNSSSLRKSVRFSEVNQERTITDVLQNGLDNAGFDAVNAAIEESVENVNAALDSFQNELENDINEKKLLQERQRKETEARKVQREEDQSKFRKPKVKMDFKVEPPTEEDSEHGVVLKFAESTMRKFSVSYRSDNTTAKKSYRHLIKGDVLVHFKGTNFHAIEGYAVSKKGKRPDVK